MIKNNYKEAPYVAEYYIMWAGMNYEDRTRIKEMRWKIINEYNSLEDKLILK